MDLLTVLDCDIVNNYYAELKWNYKQNILK